MTDSERINSIGQTRAMLSAIAAILRIAEKP